jgi:Sulfotransferase domain
MSLHVIGTGFGRTGTDSMREALTILGFGPCHHMFEVIGSEEQRRRWRAMVQGEMRDWDYLFEGYNSCVDWPSAHYWPELIAAYPDAKVILTWRDPASWWDSFARTIVPGLNQSTDPQSLGLALVKQIVFGGNIMDRDHCIAIYNANVAAVKTTVPLDRLLVHQLGDGWGPLCAHLGVPVPSQPYPDRNNTDAFKERTKDLFGKP